CRATVQEPYNKPVFLGATRLDRHRPAYLLESARLMACKQHPTTGPEFESGVSLMYWGVVTPDADRQRLRGLEVQTGAHQGIVACDQKHQVRGACRKDPTRRQRRLQ